MNETADNGQGKPEQIYERIDQMYPEFVDEGRHILFKHPGGRIQNRQDASAVAPGIDAKGDAGFFVAAPSLHASGKRYQWDGLRVFHEVA